MINYKRNLMFALGAVGVVSYFVVPGFYKTGDFWQLVNGGRWPLYVILVLACQVVMSLVDGFSNQKGFRTTLTESLFVVPITYAIAIALLCLGVRIWNAGGKEASDYKTHAQGVMEKRNQHEAAEAGG